MLGWLIAVDVRAGAAILSGITGWQGQSTIADAGVKVAAAIPAGFGRFGFVPVRLAIDNPLARDLHWQAVFELTSYRGAGPTTSTTTIPLVVPAGRVAERWIYLPTAESGIYGGGSGYYYAPTSLQLRLEGSGTGSAHLLFSASPGGGSTPMAPWAVSAALMAATQSRIAGLTPATGSRAVRFRGPRPMSVVPNLSGFDPAQVATDWRAWTPFARVVMRLDEYDVMLPAGRAALRDWVTLGGALYLSPRQARQPAIEPLGAGTITTLADPIESGVGDSAGLFAITGLQNGTRALPAAGDLSLQKGGLADRVPAAKRVGDWLIGFFVGFAVLIAPINLYVIAPAKRRHWLFLTLPAISLVAVGVLAAAIYLQDGAGGDGARRALIVLLPSDNKAVVFQDQVTRTGLLLTARFALPEDVLCAEVAAEDSSFQAGRALRFERTDGVATGDWFRARARQAQHLRRLVPTRARIEMVGQGAGGAPIVVSTMPVRVHDFYFLDAMQHEWHAAELGPGARVTLQPVAGPAGFARVRAEFAATGSVHFRDLLESAAASRSGHFVAQADSSELAPIPTLERLRWNDSAVLLTGVVAGADGRTAGE